MAADPTADKNPPLTAGAFDRLPDDLGPSLPLDDQTSGNPGERAVEESPTHIQEGVTVSSTLDDTPPEARDPYERPETEAERTVKAAGAQLMPR